MAISRPCYATREAVKRALDFEETSRTDGQVDRAIEASSDDVEGFLHRRFFPQLTTRYFDWPDRSYSVPWRLWLDSNELISVTTLTSGGVPLVEGDDFILRRSDNLDEPPYNCVEINLAGRASFGGGATPQRDIAILGLYGHSAKESAVGTLASSIDADDVTVGLSASGNVGVGDVIRIGSERMLVTDRGMLDTGLNLAADLADSEADTLVATTGGTPSAGETVLIDAERMLVVDVAGSNLIVRRGWDGSVLASHTSGADIYAARSLTVERGVLGTTAASHSSSTAVVRHVPPALVRDLGVAEAIEQLLQESSGYARPAGSGQDGASATRSNKNTIGAGIDTIRDRAHTAYGRKARTAAV